MNVVSHTHPALEITADVNERYPFRLPDWFWQDPDREFLISAEDYIIFAQDGETLKALNKVKDCSPASSTRCPNSADKLENDIASRLASKFSIRDLSASAFVARNERDGLELGLQIDPSFDDTVKRMLQNAASLFLYSALDGDLIQNALERSSKTPSPMPAKYEIQDNQNIIDDLGRRKYSDDYSFYLRSRVKPSCVSAFANQLKTALSPLEGDPTVLIISRYVGNVWWGGAYYSFFYSPYARVSREDPPRGFFYIRLNSDKLTSPEPHANDARFWASKIAHEMLHNLGYWHPNYKDAAERDENNTGNEWAFIVSYETALYEHIANK